MKGPRFSVVINTYNRASSLPATLDGLTRQTYPDFEVVVVNGPSTDGTEAMLEKWTGKLRVVDCPEVHLGKSRNHGIVAAAGDVVAFIDDDAVPEPDWIEGLAAAYDDERVAAAGGLVFDHTGMDFQYKYSVCDRSGDPRFDVSPPFDAYLQPGADPFVYLQGTNASFRRADLQAIGGFDETIEYYLDETEVCMQIVDRGRRIAPIDGAAVHHRFLPSHLRATRKVWTNPYPAVKNRHYFALRNARKSPQTLSDVLRRLQAWTDEVLSGGEFELRAAGYSQEERDLFKSRVAQGVSDGFELGVTGERQSVEIADRDDDAFVRFPIRVPTGKRLRLCFVSEEYPPGEIGGIGRFTHDTARGLADFGHEVHVVTRSEGPDHLDIEEGVWVHRMAVRDRFVDGLDGMPLQGNLLHIGTMHNEVRRLHERRPLSLVSAPIWNCENLFASLDGSFPTVTTLHTTIRKVAELLPSMRENPHVRALSRLEEHSLAVSSFLHANSEATLEAAGDTTGKTAEVIYFGLEDRATDVAPAQKDPGRVRVLFVGRLEHRKGADVLLEVVPDLLREFPDLEFVIAGKDTEYTASGRSYRGAFEKRHASSPGVLDRVTFTGAVDDEERDRLYASCDVFCAPSRYESFGLVIVEAMMFAKPVVACSAGGMPEIIDGNGLLAEPGDPATLRDTLRELIADADLREKMGRTSRELFEQVWDLPRGMRRIEETYTRFAEIGGGKARDPLTANRLADVLADVGATTPGKEALVASTLLDPHAYAHEREHEKSLAVWKGRLRRAAQDPIERGVKPVARRLVNWVRIARNIPRQIDAIRQDQQHLQAAQRSTNDRLDTLSQFVGSAGDRIDTVGERIDVLSRDVHRTGEGLGDWLEVLGRKQDAMAMDLRERIPPGPAAEDLMEPRVLVEGGLAGLLEGSGGTLRVNLGCGEKTLPDYVNVDARPLPEVAVVADVRRLPFEPGSLDEIASHHLIEHFRRHEFEQVVLPYWRSLLKPGGALRIVCPDWTALIEATVSGDLAMEDFTVATFGLQDYTGDDHFAMYSADMLESLLRDAGFDDVEVIATGRRNGLTYEMELLAR